jgi:hypothetical protein
VERSYPLLVAAFALPVFLTLTATGCGKKHEDSPAPAAKWDAFKPGDVLQKEAAPEDRVARAPADGKVEQAKDQKQPAKDALKRKIVYTATVRLVVEDFDKAEQELDKLLDANEGIIVNGGSRQAAGSRQSAEWKVRVPVEKFKGFLAAVAKLGQLEDRNINSQDVTEEYYDLKTRIKNREAREAALRMMYDDWQKKANKVEDILPIDREIAQVRESIESAQGRLQVLAQLSEMATITIHMNARKGYVPAESPTFGTKVDRTWSGSLDSLSEFGQWLALFAIALGPWLPLIALVVVPLWIIARRHRARAAPVAVQVAPAAPAPPGGQTGQP